MAGATVVFVALSIIRSFLSGTTARQPMDWLRGCVWMVGGRGPL